MTESILYTLDVIQFRLFKQYRNYVIRDLWIANIFDNIRNSPRKICLSSGVLRISGVCEIFFQKMHGANRQKRKIHLTNMYHYISLFQNIQWAR